MEYAGDGWLGYDRRFRQQAAANPDTVWARIDPTLWNIAFAGQERASRCRFCFSLSHHAEDCDWAPSPTKSPPQEASSGKLFSTPFRSRGASGTGSPVCYEWNFNPDPVCPHPGCKYRHICIYCSNDARVTDKEHKAVHCSRRRRQQPWQINTGPTAEQLWEPLPALLAVGAVHPMLQTCQLTVGTTCAVFSWLCFAATVVCLCFCFFVLLLLCLAAIACYPVLISHCCCVPLFCAAIVVFAAIACYPVLISHYCCVPLFCAATVVFAAIGCYPVLISITCRLIKQGSPSW